MAVEVLAVEGGPVILGPGMRRQRVRENTRVIWYWPLEGKKGDEGYRPLPKSWKVLRTVGGSELERRSAPTEVKVDKQRQRGRTDTVDPFREVNRGYTPEDQAMISAAMEALTDENDDHWTKAGLPDIAAVREQFEKIEMETTGARNWPSWLTREMCSLIDTRKRGDVKAEAGE